QRTLDARGGVRAGADGRGALPEGRGAPPAARLGRAAVRRDALGGTAARRTLRRHGAARAVRPRSARLLPRTALKQSDELGPHPGARLQLLEPRAAVEADRRAVDQHVA